LWTDRLRPGTRTKPERVLELMTDDIVYDDSGWPQTMRGHADVRELLDFT